MTSNGDFYINNLNGDFYLRENNAWSLKGNIGPNGSAGHGPPSALGLYIDVDTGDIYENAVLVGSIGTGPAGHDGRDGFPGMPGQDGADGEDSFIPGPPGSPGSAGAPGSDGARGADGSPGFPGEDGADGQDSYIPGPPGSAGASGADGARGADGFPGFPGEDGADGQDSFIPGPPGANGTNGAPGADGARGADGFPGFPGEDGADGQDSYIPGPPGASGTNGSNGADGARGADGFPGFPGDDGRDGEDSFIPGRDGAAGTNGTNGADGAAGPMGLGFPGEDGQPGEDGFSPGYPVIPAVREIVTANRTYFIRSDGSNSNNGLTDSASGAFLTIQKFFDVVATLDIRAIVTGNITVAGTYAGAVAKGPWIGSNYSVVLNGDSSTPSNILINSTGFTAQEGAQFTIQGMKTSGVAFKHVYAKDPGSHIIFTGNWEFSTCSGQPNMMAELGGKITYAGGSTISASAANHMLAGSGGTIKVSAATVTLTGTPNFTVAFAQASGGEIITASQTFSGSATGIRFAIDSGGKISRGTGTINLNYFPGDTAGTIAEGWYQGVRYTTLTSKSVAYTTVATDMNGILLHPAADTTARTFTIDSNANVPYPIGTTITFVNGDTAGTLTIAITSDTLRLAGNRGTIASWSLGPNTAAIAWKVAATEWLLLDTSNTRGPPGPPGQDGADGEDGQPGPPGTVPSVREQLSADRTYYIRTDGADTNTGLADTAGGAFLTIQKFFNTLATLDIKTFNVTGQVRTGTFAGATMSGPALGTGTVTLLGDTTTPANCILSSALALSNSSIATARGFKSTSSGDGLTVSNLAILTFGEWDFGVCTGVHVNVSFAAMALNVGTNYTISGGAAQHVQTIFAGIARIQNQTVTLTGTPAFTQFINCVNGSYGHVFPTFSGAATGIKFNVNNGSRITGGGADFNFFPGNAAGTISTGGQYNGFTPMATNSKSAAYTTVATDANNTILHPSADTTARTFTIDSNTNVPYPVGTQITFVNQNAAGVVTIAITTDTMRLSPGGTTGSRSLAANGVAVAQKITTTEWIISGTGLT